MPRSHLVGAVAPIAALLAGLAPSAAAQRWLAVDTGQRKLATCDWLTGALVDPDFADLAAAGIGTPIEVLEVGDELWVSDQTGDQVVRLSHDGQTVLGTLPGALDNVRGMALQGGEVFIANAGTANGAPGEALVRYSLGGTRLGSFPAVDPFDVIAFEGDLLVSSPAGDDLLRYATDGTPLGVWHDSDGTTGIDQPMQLAPRPETGGVLAGGFVDPVGLYVYDATGAEVQRLDFGPAIRGVAALGSGMLLCTSPLGMHVIDPRTGARFDVAAGAFGFVSPYTGTGTGTAYCFGDGTGAFCPCANFGAVGHGCANGAVAAGARLVATGLPSCLAATFELAADGLPPGQPGLFFQGRNASNGGLGLAFGDGLRCVGGGVARLQVVPADATGSAHTSVDLGAAGDAGLGMTLRYQLWYRDPAGSPCATGFNLTNGLEVTWGL